MNNLKNTMYSLENKEEELIFFCLSLVIKKLKKEGNKTQFAQLVAEVFQEHGISSTEDFTEELEKIKAKFSLIDYEAPKPQVDPLC